MPARTCRILIAKIALCLMPAPVLIFFSASAAENWPQFRGPNCSGVAHDAKPPVEISPTNNVLWKTEIPWSPSSPCVWGNRIFLTTYADGELQTRAYDTSKGHVLWSKGIKPERLEVFHRTESSPATATPATDGRSVVSYFGSVGLLCHDFAGKELWRHPLPIALSGGGFGSGTSPAIYGKLVLLNRDQDENSSVLAVDVETGKTVWETKRPDAIGSFGTPIVWKNDGLDEVVMPGSLRLKAYQLKTGKERWMVDKVVGFACTTPVVGEGMLFYAGWSPGKADSPWPTWEKFLEKNDKNHDGAVQIEEFDPEDRDFARGMDRDHDGKITKADWDVIQSQIAKAENVLVAVKQGGQGDITETHVAWRATRGLPYVPSPLFYAGRLYLIKDGGMVSCFEPKTGKPFYLQERLEGGGGSYYASPVAADGRIYVITKDGKLTVLKAGSDKPQILHQANFLERVFATPALVGERIYLRTETKLYAFGKR